jgi:hypothetical protein
MYDTMLKVCGLENNLGSVHNLMPDKGSGYGRSQGEKTGKEKTVR